MADHAAVPAPEPEEPPDELYLDLKRNMEGVISIETRELREYMGQTVWPFFEAVLERVKEQGDAIVSLIEESDELLHAETGAMIVQLIGLSAELVTALKGVLERSKPSPQAAKLMAKIGAFGQLAAQVQKVVDEITISDSEEEEETEDDEEDEDEDEDEEEDDEEEDDDDDGDE